MFHDVRFPTSFQYGAQGGPTFSTAINQNNAGYEQRNQLWSQARRSYSYSNELQTETEYAEILAFFYGRRGMAYSFRVKDWFDYRVLTAATGVLIGVTSGLEAGDGAETEFQLQKKYTYGAYTYTREITKPVNQAVYTDDEDVLVPTVIYKDGVAFSSEGVGWTIAYATGIVTFASPVALSVVPAWKGHFDVPVRFESDNLPSTYAQFNDLQAELKLIEVRSEEAA